MAVELSNRVDTCIRGTTFSGFLSSEEVANYLGIRYAEIPSRFRNARLLDLQSPGGIIDATAYGPRCPQPHNAGRDRRKHLYEGILPVSSIPTSEFACLNLNVYTPPTANSSLAKLPVVVWIHGGGFIFGEGCSEYDGNHLIRQAITLGKPFVFVTINYRLGFYGFLSSRELEAEALQLGEEYCPNQGLRDQRLALQWIQANIEFFGGDPSNVTIAGQSAGGFAALSHLVTDTPLCHRGWIMSSTLSPFEGVEECQNTFDRLVSSSGLGAPDSDSTKLSALRSLTPEQMNRFLGNRMLMRPAWDSKQFTYQDQASPISCISGFPPWVKGLTIGWAHDEFAMFHRIWKSWSPEELRKVITSAVLDPELAGKILQVYQIDTDSQEQAARGLLDFSTDSFYAALPVTLADRNVPTSVYRFDQIDPFEESIYRGYAYHCLDTPLLCRLPGVAGPQAPSSLRATADFFSRSLTEFLYGNPPWECFNDSGKVMLVNGEQSGLVDWPNDGRWKQFMLEKEGAIRFANAGCALVSYMADFYM